LQFAFLKKIPYFFINGFPFCYFLLPISYCQLPIALCLLLIAYCLFPISYCLLTIAYCLFPIAYCPLLIAYCRLPITNCYLYFSGFLIMWLNNLPTSSVKFKSSSYSFCKMYLQAKANSSQVWVSAFSISESDTFETK
jgi:hypothetical protein